MRWRPYHGRQRRFRSCWRERPNHVSSWRFLKGSTSSMGGLGLSGRPAGAVAHLLREAGRGVNSGLAGNVKREFADECQAHKSGMGSAGRQPRGQAQGRPPAPDPAKHVAGLPAGLCR
ncbi:hypothetical protein HOE425_333138 [Hoeflea sp. EC-HK425]|nr:hypothetical protein HOE425_333138 [Hoeflea sp. EC-HK425]